MVPINYVAVLIAAIANFVIGFLLHGPLGGKLWMKLANIKPTGKEKMSDMVPMMVKNLIANVLFAYALAIVYTLATTSSVGQAPGIAAGICVAIIAWLGFVVTSTSMDAIWMGKSWKLWAYEAYASLVCTVAMGVIIAVMV
ncbi:MAG TPA: DUF1761 domain-containing protein [Acidobacteriota bacterium]|nr:DUF1761 domain-containing protein [Acidobacteriota bacterium]